MYKYSNQKSQPDNPAVDGNRIDMRAQLKRALFDLEVARNKRSAGCAVRAPHADMQRLETSVMKSSDAFNKLMQKMISQQSAGLSS